MYVFKSHYEFEVSIDLAAQSTIMFLDPIPE